MIEKTKNDVKERIDVNYRRPAFWGIVAALVLCIAAAFLFLDRPATDDSPSPSVSESKTPVQQEGTSAMLDDKILTLEALLELGLTTEGGPSWTDLEGYTYTDESSGPFLRRSYPMENGRSLLVEGVFRDGSLLANSIPMDGRPVFMRLCYGPYEGDCTDARLMMDAETYVGVLEEQEETGGLSSAGLAMVIRSELEGIQPDPVDVLRSAPNLALGDRDGCVLGMMYGGSWKYDIRDLAEFNNMGGGGRALHPLDESIGKMRPDVLTMNAGDRVYLLFDVRETQPDTVTVTCWPDGSWGQTELEGEALEVDFDGSYYSFCMKEGSNIYDVSASWDHWGRPENYQGNAHYSMIGVGDRDIIP